MDIGASFWWPDAFPGINQLRIREETLGFGNLLSDTWISASVPWSGGCMNLEPVSSFEPRLCTVCRYGFHAWRMITWCSIVAVPYFKFLVNQPWEETSNRSKRAKDGELRTRSTCPQLLPKVPIIILSIIWPTNHLSPISKTVISKKRRRMKTMMTTTTYHFIHPTTTTFHVTRSLHHRTTFHATLSLRHRRPTTNRRDLPFGTWVRPKTACLRIVTTTSFASRQINLKPSQNTVITTTTCCHQPNRSSVLCHSKDGSSVRDSWIVSENSIEYRQLVSLLKSCTLWKITEIKEICM